MNRPENTGPAPSPVASAEAPGPPRVDMATSGELQAWLARLQQEERQIGRRNRYLAGAAVAGTLLLLILLAGIHRATIGSYSSIDQIEIRQHPADPGRLQIKFNVLSPGKVYCRRVSGDSRTDVIDYFAEPCQVDRPWSWAYRPGQPIEATLWYRRGLLQGTSVESFPTKDRVDIVVLIDTTESMDGSIEQLKQQCTLFAAELQRQALTPRFGLIGFGDANHGPALDVHPLTADVAEFAESVAQLKRFQGVDPAESALDALETALELPLDDGAIRRFYLVSDAGYHETTLSGITAQAIAGRLREGCVSLRVFSRAEHQAQYAKLLDETGRFQEIENFGRVIAQGRVLED